MLTVYGHPASRAFRVYWMLEELKLKYDFVPTNTREAKSPDFLKINPNGKIPALKDGDTFLFESAAICYHLATKVKEQTLIPKEGTFARAEVDQWMFWVMSELEQPLWWNSKNAHGLPEELRYTDFRKQADYEYSKQKEVLKQHLKGREFLVGEQFSVADLFCAHTLNWGKDFLTAEDEILDQYIANMKSRPSFNAAKGLLKKL
jgi:glutathione S-transferase